MKINPRPKLFVKMYIRARESGLLALISTQDWHLLCVLATYMNRQGRCNPSQETLANVMGINRSSVARRIRSLERFRFHGQPLIRITRNRIVSGKFESLGYEILPSASLEIFMSPKP